MSVEPFITEHLDLWTDAITTKSTSGRGNNSEIETIGIEKLRELILEFAVRGKLAPQHDSDEPAQRLLKQIAEKKTQLQADGQIKNSKELPSVTDGESRFDLPSNWIWTRLGTIAQISPKNTTEDQTEASFVPMSMITTSYTGDHSQEKRQWSDIKKGYTHFADGDIALAKITPCFENSKAAVFRNLHNGIGAGTTELHVVRPYGTTIDPFFILYCLKSPGFLIRGEARMTGTAGQKRLPKDFFATEPIPLPPLAEQHRIVQKVDELMALCDRLEQQTRDQHAAHETLVDALLDTLTQSKDANELADNWARLAAHFDTLFTTEHSIERLKQTALQLGVMGRLAPQISSEQPAQCLLSKIEQNRKNFPNHGRSGREKPLSSPLTTDHPFVLPEGWALTRLDNVTHIQSGIAKGKKHKDVQTVMSPYLRVANVQRAELNLDGIKELEVTKQDAERYSLKPRDLLITEGGDWDKVGRTAIWDGSIKPMIHQNHVFRARLFSEEQNERWLEMYLNSAFAKQYFADSSKQTTNLASINKTQLRSCTIPLPPAEEQARIIRKADELIAICNRLKASVRRSSETRFQMADAVVEQAIH